MTNRNKKVEWLAWAVLALVILGVAGAFVRSRLNASNLPVLSRLPDFNLTNQLGQKFSLADMRGKVWVADIIFTRCAGPCPRMTKQLSELQPKLPQEIQLVTLTADPEFDTVPVLKKYADRFEADHSRWHFLTGPKKELYTLAGERGLLLSAVEKEQGTQENENDLFIHSTLFILVDKLGRVRAAIESTEPDTNEKIISQTRALLRER